MIQFSKLLNWIVRGQFSLGQTLQVIALGQKDTSPGGDTHTFCIAGESVMMTKDSISHTSSLSVCETRRAPLARFLNRRAVLF